ncbi:iron ABC transporter permease [Paenibacillus sp. PK3_47]|uniref:FecCD family ABC transporter permease n=1 Tax=Paenibacillus sp. PK3_47 TaxID=2072642 RepID=UPI00201D9C1D|nr:iron ABC transporter permease [Paenibacillus sp. PK3_47]UQZ37002.1 iron ABC transporter permease [Paenibacillus sp. PK3_47]
MENKHIQSGEVNLRDKPAYALVMIALFAVTALGAIIFGISVGAVKVPLQDLIRYVFDPDFEGPLRNIVWNIRIPRVIVGVFVGAGLAVSGSLLQGVMRNPLADPHIIGVSSGAGLFGIFVMIVLPQFEYLLTPVAFVGASAAAAIIYVLAWKDGVQPVRIVLAGVAVSAFLGSGISGLMIFYSDRVQSALVFMVGGLAAKSWPHVQIIGPYALIGILLAGFGAKKMNLLMLGDSAARNLGVRVEWLRLGMTAVATLLAASSVSVAGLLGFVGLIVPHAARLVIGTDYRFLVPASALLGAAVITFCDTIARIVWAPTELPVGIIMGALGAPFFLYLLRRKAA